MDRAILLLDIYWKRKYQTLHVLYPVLDVLPFTFDFRSFMHSVSDVKGVQLGRLNLLTPKRTKRAASEEIRTGEIVPVKYTL